MATKALRCRRHETHGHFLGHRSHQRLTTTWLWICLLGNVLLSLKCIEKSSKQSPWCMEIESLGTWANAPGSP